MGRAKFLFEQNFIKRGVQTLSGHQLVDYIDQFDALHRFGKGAHRPHLDGLLLGLLRSARQDLFGGEELILALGTQNDLQQGPLKGMALNLEYGLPFYQSLNGPQPKELGRFDLGCNWSF